MFRVFIPARYDSQRLPGKPLLPIAGQPMIQHVYERAAASGAAQVVVVTDDERIAGAVADFGGEVLMTGSHHRSGTERIAEAVDALGLDASEVIVNLQGDEPTMPAALIDQCAALLDDDQADIATLASPFLTHEDFVNPNCVKVIRDEHDHAIYFSRAAIPYARDAGKQERAAGIALHHHGIYAYRCGVLRQFVAASASPLEVSEQLEQLRALSLGMTIVVGVPACRPGIGVDTATDLERAASELESLEKNNIFK